MDRYPPELPRRWSEAVALLSEDTLNAHGILPWHLERSFWQLVEAFQQRQTGRILKLSADIGHYLGDAHVPLHTTANYNGQLTGQQGIHGLWEALIPERFGEGYDYWVGQAVLWRSVQDTIWAIIYETHGLVEQVLDAEREATAKVGEAHKFTYRERGRQTVRTYSEEFLQVYHGLLEGMVERQLRRAVQRLASFWYTAWHLAGRPNLLEALPPEVPTEDTYPDSLPADPRCPVGKRLSCCDSEHWAAVSGPAEWDFVGQAAPLCRRERFILAFLRRKKRPSLCCSGTLSL